MVVSSDAPQTRTVPEGRSCRRAQGATAIALRTCPFRFAICLRGATLVPDAVLLARRPYRPFPVALACIVAVAGVAGLQLLAA